MKFLDWMERTIRPIAIPNLTLGIIAIQVLVYVMSLSNPGFTDDLVLLREPILQGQVWRVFTFLFVPPTQQFIFLFFFWYLMYLFGTALETQWGIARYNLFLGIGFAATVSVTMIFPNGFATNAFLYGSIFLAFAHLYPEFTLNLYFILPIQIRWLAYLMWAGFAWEFITGNLFVRCSIVAAVANFSLFFGPSIFQRLKRGRIQQQRKTKQTRADQRARHTCSVCGVTNLSDPHMEFRYCSKCVGDPCYCLEHLASHEHIKDPATKEH